MKVDMKSTEYYKSGRHADHLRQMSIKAKETNRALRQKRINEYSENPKLCTHCGIPLTYEQRGGKFCSRSCSAKYHNKKRTDKGWLQTEETKTKISEKNKGRTPFCKGKRLNQHGKYVDPNTRNIDFEEIKRRRAEQRQVRIMEQAWDTMSWDIRRERVILEQKGKCNHCGITEWSNHPIILEIDHIDGDNKNNERTNLEGLCPNCHSVTDTWRGRNKVKIKKSTAISNEEKVKAYLETGNIRQALLKLGLAAKGSNYGQMKRALTEWGIDYD